MFSLSGQALAAASASVNQQPDGPKVPTEITYMAFPQFDYVSERARCRRELHFFYFLGGDVIPAPLEGAIANAEMPDPARETLRAYCPPHLGNTISTLPVCGSTTAT